MKLRNAAIFLLLIILLLSNQVLAFELEYHGRRSVWADLELETFNDQETGEELYRKEDWSFDQLFEISFHGQEKGDYIKGYITTGEEMEDLSYLDLLLKPYYFRWDNFEKAFAIPSWFNMQQDVRGLRTGYFDQRNRVGLIYLEGEHYVRDQKIMLNPTNGLISRSLRYYPIVRDTTQVWLEGKELEYGIDYDIDHNRGVINLNFPIFEPKELRVKYLQSGIGYTIEGSRLDRHFTQNLMGGMVLLKAHGIDMEQHLLGSEWDYRITPNWNISLNAGLVERDGQLSDLNWRLGQKYNKAGLELDMNYQEVKDNFQGLLFGGFEGKKLHLAGKYQSDKLMARLNNDFKWNLDHTLFRREGEGEFIWLDSKWIPYIYYFNSQDATGHVNEHGIAELGYQESLTLPQESMTYFFGADYQSSYGKKETVPYLGLTYRRNFEKRLGFRIYGQNNMESSKLTLFGDWLYGPVKWNGELNYQPDYYLMEHNLTTRDNEFIDANLDWTLTENENNINTNIKLWLRDSSHRELGYSIHENNDNIERTYYLGGEWSIAPGTVTYLRTDIGEMEKSYTVGARQLEEGLEYDMHYSLSEVEMLGQEDLRRDIVGISVGRADIWNFNAQIENASFEEIVDLNFKYPIYQSTDLSLDYHGEFTAIDSHQLTVGTSYYF